MSTTNAKAWAAAITAALGQHSMANYEATESLLSPWPDDPDGSTLRFSAALRKVAEYALTRSNAEGEYLLGELWRALGMHETVDQGTLNIAGYVGARKRCTVMAVTGYLGTLSPEECAGIIDANGVCARVGYHADRPYSVCPDCNMDWHRCPGCGAALAHGQSECGTGCVE